MTLNDLYTQFFDADYLRNGITYRHSVIEMGLTTYATVSLRMTVSDLAKYSVT